jgi:hypothetical protein
MNQVPNEEAKTTYTGNSDFFIPTNPFATTSTYSYPFMQYDHLHAYVKVIESLREILNNTNVDRETKQIASLKINKYLELL